MRFIIYLDLYPHHPLHFGLGQISQNPPDAVELVEIVPHRAVMQLHKSDQSEVGFNLHNEQGT